MLILTSNGITSEKLHNEIQVLLPENAEKAALITTASYGYKAAIRFFFWMLCVRQVAKNCSRSIYTEQNCYRRKRRKYGVRLYYRVGL